jgi:hypothetical protein
MTSAFDTVHHSTLLAQLRDSYQVTNSAHAWFSSYLQDRSQSVRTPTSVSQPSLLTSGVPQGSILGPILCSLYIADVVNIVRSLIFEFTFTRTIFKFMDFVFPLTSESLIIPVSNYISDIDAWLHSNNLQLNLAKTEVLWCSSPRRQNQIPQDFLHILNLPVSPVS